MSMQHAWCMLLYTCTFSTGGKFNFYVHIVTRSYSNLMQHFQENKVVQVILVHAHSQGTDVGGEGWLGCEPVEGVVVLEER